MAQQTEDNLLFTEVMSTPLTKHDEKKKGILSYPRSVLRFELFPPSLFFSFASLSTVMLLHIRQNNLFPDKQKQHKKKDDMLGRSECKREKKQPTFYHLPLTMCKKMRIISIH